MKKKNMLIVAIILMSIGFAAVSTSLVISWRDSIMYSYLENFIYNNLSYDLQNVIIPTKVISGHGSYTGESNFETKDKLYFLSNKEVWGKASLDTIYSNKAT